MKLEDLREATHRRDVLYGAQGPWVTTHVTQTCFRSPADGIGTHIVVRERDSVQQMELDADLPSILR